MVLWKSWGERCALRQGISGAPMVVRAYRVLELSKAILTSTRSIIPVCRAERSRRAAIR